MQIGTTCPDARVLEHLLRGEIPAAEAEQLEAHIADCPRCGASLQQIRVDDPLVEALRHTPPIGHDDSELVEALIPCLKRLRPGEPARARREEPQAFAFLAPPQAADELGRLGPYRVLKVLGAGGMGVVFLADDPRLKRQIALKVIKPELVQHRQVHERFLREAQAVAKVEHENIITIFQVDEAAGVPYLAMPLLRGETLEEHLGRAGGRLPLDELLRIGREVADGLAAAHERGLIHRDIKPANIFLAAAKGRIADDTATLLLDSPPMPSQGKSGQAGSADDGPAKVKILDFGLARAVCADESGLSQQGQILGTPAYMAPEQCGGRLVDHRADLFSLGCVLYRMATGQPAFRGSDFMSVLVSVAMDTPRPVRELNPQAPPALARLIEQLLAKDAAERPASARAVADALAAIEQEQRAAARLKPSRRKLVLGAAAAILVAPALGAGLTYWLTRPAPPAPVPCGEVTFDFDEPVKLAIRRGEDDEKIVDAKDSPKVSLPPGSYRVRATDRPGERVLVPDEFEVKAGESRTVRLRLVGELRTTGKAHDRAVMGVAVTPKKGAVIVASASLEGRVGVWQPLAEPPGDSLEYLEGHTSGVQAVAFDPEGRRVASGAGWRPQPRTEDALIRIWDVAKRVEVDRLPGHPNRAVQALAFTPNGKRLLSGADDGSVYLWDLGAHDKRELKITGVGSVHAVAVSADGKQALVGGDKGAVLWDLDADKEIKRLEGHPDAVRGVLCGPGANEVVTACDDGVLRVWDLKGGEKPRELRGHKKGELHAALSPDGGRLLSGGDDGTIRLWDVKTGRQLYQFNKLGDPAVHGVAFTADGRRAVSGGADQAVRLWELPP